MGLLIIPEEVYWFLEENELTIVRKDNIHPLCDECGDRVMYQDHYMVKDVFWLTVAKFDVYLHAWCLSKRLGRPLRRSDFTDVRVNRTHLFLRDG